MKTQRQFLCAAWLTVCALFLLSACRGPTPIAGRVAEITATGVASNTPLPATPTASHTPTAESTATPTPKPADTATPTDTNTPIVDPTETSTPTPTAEMVRPAEIVGLKLVDGQYVAEKGNPYGVAVGEVVGRPTSIQVKGIGGKVRNPIDGTFEEVGFVRQSAVVISNQQVLAHFMNEANTPGNVKAGKWRIPVPFVPGSGTRIWEVPTLVQGKFAIEIDGLSSNSNIVNPFSKPALVKRYIYNQNEQSIGIFFPKGMAPQENLNWMLKFFFSQARTINVNNEGKVMPAGAILATGVSGNLPQRHDKVPQAALTIGNLNGGDSLALTNFLHINEALVFVNVN